VALGGTNAFENLAPSHLKCNQARGATALDEHRSGWITGNLTVLQMIRLLFLCRSAQIDNVHWRAITVPMSVGRRLALLGALVLGVLGMIIGLVMCCTLFFMGYGIELTDASRRYARTKLRTYVQGKFDWKDQAFTWWRIVVRQRGWPQCPFIKNRQRRRARRRSSRAYRRYLSYPGNRRAIPVGAENPV
jgi:hypothetical protein